MKLTIKTLLARRLGLLGDEERKQAEALLEENESASKTDRELNASLNGEGIRIPDRLANMGDAIWEAAQKENRGITPFPARKKRRLPLAAAAGLLLAAGALFLFSGKKIPETGFASVKGGVAINGRNTDRSSTMKPGQTLSAKSGATAKLALPARGTLRFSGPGALRLVASAVQKDKPQQKWFLKKGSASVSLKPGSYSGFSITTPHLTLRVTGTRFTVAVDDNGTKINVIEGRVAVQEKNKPEKPLVRGQSLQSVTDPGNSGDPSDNRKPPGDINTPSGKTNNHAGKKTGTPPLTKPPAIRKTIREEILLNNGTTLTGRILSQSGGIITFRTGAGTLKIPRSDVKRIRIIKKRGQ